MNRRKDNNSLLDALRKIDRCKKALLRAAYTRYGRLEAIDFLRREFPEVFRK